MAFICKSRHLGAALHPPTPPLLRAWAAVPSRAHVPILLCLTFNNHREHSFSYFKAHITEKLQLRTNNETSLCTYQTGRKSKCLIRIVLHCSEERRADSPQPRSFSVVTGQDAHSDPGTSLSFSVLSMGSGQRGQPWELHTRRT